MFCLQKGVWALPHLFCSSQKFSLLKLVKNGSKICPSFSRSSPGSVLPGPALSVCMHVVSYRNDKLSWDAGMSLKEFPFKEAYKLLATMSICDSAVYLILIKHFTSVLWFCFAGRNHSCFQLCMLPLYLVVGT